MKAHKAQKHRVVERIRLLRVVEWIGVLKVEGDGRAKCWRFGIGISQAQENNV